MPRSSLVRLPPRCWLVLALLLLPLSASAQRGGQSREEEELDPVCRRKEGACLKFRLGLIGGGVLTPERIGPGLGLKGGITVVFLPNLELGAQMVGLLDALGEGRPYISAGEGLLRVAVQRGRQHKLFLELSGGVALPNSSEVQHGVSPSGTVGFSFEAATGYTSGLSLTGGLTVLRLEQWTALPHVGVGFFL